MSGTEELDNTGTMIDDLYSERAHLVALLATEHQGVYKEDPENEGWILVYVDLPTGQASWHIHPEDRALFTGVRFAPDVEWDGHTTEVKYARIRELIGVTQ